MCDTLAPRVLKDEDRKANKGRKKGRTRKRGRERKNHDTTTNRRKWKKD